MCDAILRAGKPRGYVALEALVSFLWGFSLKQKKPLVYPVGGIDQSIFMRGCVSEEVISRVGYAQSREVGNSRYFFY